MESPTFQQSSVRGHTGVQGKENYSRKTQLYKGLGAGPCTSEDQGGSQYDQWGVSAGVERLEGREVTGTGYTGLTSNGAAKGAPTGAATSTTKGNLDALSGMSWPPMSQSQPISV